MFLNTKPYLTLLQPDGKEKTFAIKGDTFVVGSEASSDIKISHPDIGENHLVIRKTDTGWTVETQGHSSVFHNGQVLTVQHLHSADRLDLPADLTFVFSNPAEDKKNAEAEKKTKQSAKKDGTAQNAKPISQNRMVPLAALFVMAVLMFALFWVVNDPDKGKAKLTVNNEASVNAAIYGGEFALGIKPRTLVSCISEAVERGKLDGWARATGTTYWSLANDYPGLSLADQLESDERFVSMRSEIERLFRLARKLESAKQNELSLETYTKIAKIIPDPQCAVNMIASARMNILGGTAEK